MINPSTDKHLDSRAQDAVRAIHEDVKSTISLARTVLPRESAGASLAVDALANALRASGRATRATCIDLRPMNPGPGCALVDGLPSGTEVIVTSERAFDGADVVVVVCGDDAGDARDVAQRAVKDVGGENVFILIEGEGEGGDEIHGSIRGVGVADVSSVETCRLIGSDAAQSTIEEVAALAWAEASMEERKWVQKLAKRLQDIVRKRCEEILEQYQPLRDIVTFWDAVVGESAEFDSSGGKARADAMLGKIISGTVAGVPSAFAPVSVLSARELAEYHREYNPDLEVSKLKSMIYADSTKSFAAGTILSLGGPLAAPLTSLPALVMYFTIRMRLCFAMVIMGEPNDQLADLRPSLVASSLLYFFGANASKIMAERLTVEELDLEDLMEDLESSDAFCGAQIGTMDESGDEQKKSLSEVLNDKMYRLGEDVRERTNAAVRSVLESGSHASRSAQRDAAMSAARVCELVRDSGGTPGEANRAAERAFARSLPVAIYKRMSAGVFTASNLPVLLCELVPAVSSYLTVRAATTAMTNALPESIAAAEQIAREAELELEEASETPPESWDETAKKGLVAATESTKRAAVAVGEATTNAFTELNRSLSRMFSSKGEN